jgi:pilus assembly protein CpaB
MPKRRGLVLITLSLLMAVGAAYVANEWVIGKVMPSTEAVDDKEQVIAAAMTIPFATKVEERHLKLIDMPEILAPEGFYTSADQVVGMVSTTAIPRGEILVSERFREHSAGSTLAALVNQDMRAVTVRVDDVVGVAGFLLPGNSVDVLASRKQTNKRAETETILRNIKVLAVDQTASADSNEPVIVRAVTLEMLPRQAEELFRARTEGTIQLTLRNPLAIEAPPEPKVVARAAPRPRVVTPPPSEVMVIRGTSIDKTKVKK